MLNPRKIIAKYRKGLIIPFTILVVLIGLINFYFVFEITPQPNDECIWQPKPITKDSVIFVFDQVKFEGVTWNAGIRDGDRLLEIEGTKIVNLIRATIILDGIQKGDSALYTVERDGRIFETKVEIKRLVLFGGMAFALLSFIWLLVGFIVITAKPNGFSQILFYRIGVMFVLFSTFNLIVINFGNNPIYNVPWLLILTDITWSFGAIYLPFLVVHFFWIFPRICKIAERKWTTKILYITPTLLFVVSILLRVFIVYPGRVNQNAFFQLYINILLIMLGIAMLIGFVSLIKNYLKLTDKQERIAIFIIILGFAFGIAAIVYSATLANVIADNIFNSPIYFTPIILIAVNPISFGYSIFRYSLMDVSDVLKNTIIYGAATITVAGIYFAVIYSLGQTISRVIGTEYQGILAGIIYCFRNNIPIDKGSISGFTYAKILSGTVCLPKSPYQI